MIIPVADFEQALAVSPRLAAARLVYLVFKSGLDVMAKPDCN